MSSPRSLSDEALDQLFREARTLSAWTAQPVTDEALHALYDLMKMGPTSVNSCPARIVFVRSPEAKEKLRPYLDRGNVDKTMSAPVTAVIGYDLVFYDRLPKLYPHTDAQSWFVGRPQQIEETAFRNSTLQGAYLILAARALGLDCGPMSGFHAEGVAQTFFPGGTVKVNFLCNLGYGDHAAIRPRNPRLDFDEVCRID